jgi:hypothetical protein
MTANLHSGTLTTDEYTLDEASNYSISSTTFVDVDGTHLALQLTPGSKATTGQALVGLHTNVALSASNQKGHFNLLVNGTLVAANDGILAVEGTLPASFTRLVTGLNVGTLNTITLQAKVTGGTMTVYNGAGTGQLDVHGQFWGMVL